jgi:hypothetical protein
MRVSIQYEDGDVETVNLRHERFEVVGFEAVPEATDVAADVFDDGAFSGPAFAAALVCPRVSRIVAQAVQAAGWGEGQELATEAAEAIAAVSAVTMAGGSIDSGGDSGTVPLAAVSESQQLSLPTAAAVLDMAGSWAGAASEAATAGE